MTFGLAESDNLFLKHCYFLVLLYVIYFLRWKKKKTETPNI